jgi:hypothetical protein
MTIKRFSPGLRGLARRLCVLSTAIFIALGQASSVETDWWEKSNSLLTKFGRLTILKPLAEIANEEGADTVLRVIHGGELGFIYSFTLVVRHKDKSVRSARLECVYCDSLDMGDLVNGAKIGRIQPPVVELSGIQEIPFEAILKDAAKFIELNQANIGDVLGNDTFIVVEQLKKSGYQIVNSFAASGSVRVANFDELRSKLGTLLYRLTKSLLVVEE